MDVQIRPRSKVFSLPFANSINLGYVYHAQRLAAAMKVGVQVVHDEFIFMSAQQHHDWLDECRRLGVPTE